MSTIDKILQKLKPPFMFDDAQNCIFDSEGALICRCDKKPQALLILTALEGLLLTQLAREYDETDDTSYWESPHPIFRMANDIDYLRAENAHLKIENNRLLESRRVGHN